MTEKLLLDRMISGDSAEILPTLPEKSIDPLYGISFMGRNWDRAVPSVQVWKECLRVLNAGSFAFVMSSPRLGCLGSWLVNSSSTLFQLRRCNDLLLR
jgi:site-specific DNA-methyltransferase (adenine-specific)